MKTPYIENALKAQGHRMTVGRKAVIDVFEKSAEPLSSLDVQAALKRRKIPANKTTVYREIDFLVKAKVLNELQFDERSKRYEVTTDEHKHHLICTNCKNIDDAVLNHDLDDVESRLKKQKNFKVQSHSLEFYGLCASCQ